MTALVFPGVFSVDANPVLGVVDKLQANGINQFLVLLHQLGKICLVQCPTPPFAFICRRAFFVGSASVY